MENKKLEIVSVSICLRGRSEEGEPVYFLCGGTEIYFEKVRLPDQGSSFFMYRVSEQNKLLVFPEFPMYYMVPFQEPERLEFYMPPEAKVLNFPLVFNNSEERRMEFTGAENSKTVVSYGSLDRDMAFRLDNRKFTVTEGCMTSVSSSCDETALDTGNVVMISPTMPEMEEMSWREFNFNYKSGPFARWTGLYRTPSNGRSKSDIQILGQRRKTLVRIPNSYGFQLNQFSVYVNELQKKRLLYVIGQPTEEHGLVWFYLPLNKHTKYQINEKGVIRLSEPNRPDHIIKLETYDLDTGNKKQNNQGSTEREEELQLAGAAGV